MIQLETLTYSTTNQNYGVVYFGLKGTAINKSELRTVVGKKESDNPFIEQAIDGLREIALNEIQVD